jgi:phenylalanyl-tRNA synthetase beta chain
LQNRLKAIGLNPKNNIVDVLFLHNLGQLHAFDASKINGKIVVQTLPAGTKFTTLDDIERNTSRGRFNDLRRKGPLCIAGVFGGKNQEFQKIPMLYFESAYLTQ